MEFHTENTVLNVGFRTGDRTSRLFGMDHENNFEPTTLINVITGVISIPVRELLVIWN